MKRIKLGSLLFALLIAACGKTDTPMTGQTSTIPVSDARITRMGRAQVVDDGGLRFSYPGVTLKFRFSGSGATLLGTSTSGNNYLDVIVDNGSPQVVKLTNEENRIALVSNDETSEHAVEIIHRGETWHGIVTLNRIEITDGDLFDPITPPARKIMIIGDSVTCGEAIDRAPDCDKNSRWWNPRLSYGMLAARELNAQVHLVCYGGRGLTRTWDGRTDTLNAPQFFDLAIPDGTTPVAWNHAGYDPDLIFISLGTNDFSLSIGPLPDEEIFVSSYVNFINRILGIHKSANVAITEGAIVNDEADPARPQKTVLRQYLNETVRRLDTERVFVIPATHYPGDSCDAHPTREQHLAMSRDLVPRLKEIMHW